MIRYEVFAHFLNTIFANHLQPHEPSTIQSNTNPILSPELPAMRLQITSLHCIRVDCSGASQYGEKTKCKPVTLNFGIC